MAVEPIEEYLLVVKNAQVLADFVVSAHAVSVYRTF